ncbi:MAG: glycosyltransferase [Acidimicrobiales bacterium]
MKLLYVIPGLGVGGGAERSLLDLAPGLAAASIELSILYFHERPSSAVDRFRALGVQVDAVQARTWPGRLLAVRRAIARARPDIVHTTLFEADVIGRLASLGLPTKVVSSLVNTSYEPNRRRDPKFSRWRVEVVRMVEACTLRVGCDRVHANSWAVARSATARLHVPPDRITVVHRGRNPDELQPLSAEARAQVRAELGIREGELLVLGVGRHEYPKGHLTLLDALPEVRRAHPNVRVAIAGREGYMTGRIRASLQWNDLEDVVQLLGHRGDVSRLLGAADVFAFPSLLEGLPGAVIEAMAMSVPLVVSDIPPIHELVDEESAVFVPTEDPQRMAAAIIDVIEDPAAAQERAAVARQRFLDEFTVAVALEGMVAFYRSVVAP